MVDLTCHIIITGTPIKAKESDPLSAGNFILFMPHDATEVEDPMSRMTLSVSGFKIVIFGCDGGEEVFVNIRARLMNPRHLLIRIPFIHKWMSLDKDLLFDAEEDLMDTRYDEIACKRSEKTYLNLATKFRFIYYCYEFEQDMTVKYSRSVFPDCHENDLQPHAVFYDDLKGCEKHRVVFLLAKEPEDERTKVVDEGKDRKMTAAEYYAAMRKKKAGKT